MFSTVPRIANRQVVLGADGLLTSGTITGGDGHIPKGIVAADIYSVGAWGFTSEEGGIVMPIVAGQITQLPGSFVRNAIFNAGTYIITFYLDA